MKGEAMQNIDKKETTSTPRRRILWISLGAVVVLAASVGLWLGLRNYGRPKPSRHAAVANMADTSSPADDDSTDSTVPDAGVQVDLGPDDLKKAQIQTVSVDTKETSSTLRVPGIVNANEYHDVHVTPLVGGVIRQVPVALGDHVRRGQPMAVIFSSDLADAETGYLAMSAALEADHKKLERTQIQHKSGKFQPQPMAQQPQRSEQKSRH